MADISLAHVGAVGTLCGLLGAGAGAYAAIYARGRADGTRDEVIHGHERRLNSMRESVKALEKDRADDRAEMRERFARMESTLDSVKDAAEETRGYVRQLAAGGKR